MSWTPVGGGGGSLFDESSKVETVNQWWRFFENEESFFENVMENEKQANAVVSSEHAMNVVFWLDKSDPSGDE